MAPQRGQTHIPSSTSNDAAQGRHWQRASTESITNAAPAARLPANTNAAANCSASGSTPARRPIRRWMAVTARAPRAAAAASTCSRSATIRLSSCIVPSRREPLRQETSGPGQAAPQGR